MTDTAVEAGGDAGALEAHLQALGTGYRVLEWQPLSGGRSATSVRVELERHGGRETCVLHMEAPHGPLHGIADLRRHYAVLRALAGHGVRAPTPRWFLDRQVLGRAGFVTKFVSGDVPDPWRAAGRDFMQRHAAAMLDTMMAGLVALHRVPVDALPAVIGGEGHEPFGSRERHRWSAVLDRSPVFADDPVLVYADHWLKQHVPARSHDGLVHGDYRVGNLVFDRDGHLAAVLDWELAEVGDPLYDLGTLCSPALEINGLVAGLCTRDALLDGYERHGGDTVDRDALDFYRVLGTFKIACLWVNASLPWSAGSGDPVALRAAFSAADVRPMLARALGLDTVPAPKTPRDDILAEVADALRGAADAMSLGQERDVVRTSAAILRRHARGFVAANDGRDGARLANDMGDAVAAATFGAGRAAPALAMLARRIFADPHTAPVSHPLHQRLRALIAATAQRSPEWGRARRGADRTDTL